MASSALILGGSFNPVHHAHLICARVAAERLGLERVLLIPSARPPHKPRDPELADAPHRLRMCQLAIAGIDGFAVDDIELKRDGLSYTIDTARQLRAGGMNEIHWLIGADMVRILPTWRQPANLLREVTFHLLARPRWTFDWHTLPAMFQPLQANVVPAPLIDISATDIRRRVAAGLPIDFLTPPAVCRYIAEHRLYPHAQSV